MANTLPTVFLRAFFFFSWFFKIFLICISNVIPFPSPNHPPFPTSPPWHSPTLEEEGFQAWQDQGLLLPLVPNKAIFCYICSRIHESVHCTLWMVVWSLGSLVGWCCCSYAVANAFSFFNFSLSPPKGTLFSVQWLSQASASLFVMLWQGLSGDSCFSIIIFSWESRTCHENHRLDVWIMLSSFFIRILVDSGHILTRSDS